ncbi:MAG: hypothetical protein GY811_02510 [Myxococcales bacterium]|nr:hypothetical protein [Myxococcales bacterium]
MTRLLHSGRPSFALSTAAALLLGTGACGSDDSEATDAMASLVDASPPDAVPPDAEMDASIFPATLEETGLYSNFADGVIAPGVLEYTPAWPLWTDGAVKRRWIFIPDGATIDTTDMDFWVLPEGTKMWKDFATPGGVRIETRYLWKMGPTSNDWYYVSFAWNAGATEAVAVPDGVSNALGTTFNIPRERDCRTCHERQPDFSLGFSAVQLAHLGSGITLDTLVSDSKLSVPPAGVSPYYPVPGTGDEQAVLGYLHGNCGGCHHKSSDVMDTTNLNLRMEVATMTSPETTTVYSTIVDVEPLITVAGTTALIEPQAINASAIYVRMNNRGSNLQMPPKGSDIVDGDFLLVLETWINSLDLPE